MNLRQNSRGWALAFMLIIVLTMFIGEMRFTSAPLTSKATDNIQVAIILDYDTTSSASLSELHVTFEKALSWLKAEGFPMSEIMVVTWRNTFENDKDFMWLMSTLEKYGVSTGNGQFGLYVAPEDANSAGILSIALETFRNASNRYPYFVAGSSASSRTYSQLVNYGVKLSFFNLWEEGEDYTYRGYSTGDNLQGANWEGSPFQPYKPSKYTADAPGNAKEDELDIWEAHWITRNPSYAYFAVNSRNMGSIHPHDLLLENMTGDQTCTPSEAIQKLNIILDLIDYNAQNNPLMTVSYPVEISYLINPEIFNFWQNTMQEFVARHYQIINAVDFRNNLENLEPATPHTPVCVWYDNMTNSDIVVKGENTPFAMVSSPYGRFIYARRDPQNDSGTPLVSIVSYTTARAYNESFQSIRELTGSDDFKMNTYVNGEPIEMRWPGDIQIVSMTPDKTIVIRWAYLKNDVPYVEYNVTTYLTPYGVLIEKDLRFKQSVNASVSMFHHFTVQDNSPSPLTDTDTRIETDEANSFRFFSTNPQPTKIPLEVNNTLAFIAKDGYTLGLTFTSGRPDKVRAIDEAQASPFETLEFDYLPRKYMSGDSLHLFYAFSPARNLQDARQLATSIRELAQMSGLYQVPKIPEYISPLLVTFFVMLTTGVVFICFRSHQRLTKRELHRT